MQNKIINYSFHFGLRVKNKYLEGYIIDENISEIHISHPNHRENNENISEIHILHPKYCENNEIFINTIIAEIPIQIFINIGTFTERSIQYVGLWYIYLNHNSHDILNNGYILRRKSDLIF
jgi:hypothetical protein